MFLGEFEQIVMLAVLNLEGPAYGLPIRREIERHLERGISPGALYTTLDRLEGKGLLKSSDKQLEESGKLKRCFEVTRVGIAALRESRKLLLTMWEGAHSTLRDL